MISTADQPGGTAKCWKRARSRLFASASVNISSQKSRPEGGGGGGGGGGRAAPFATSLGPAATSTLLKHAHIVPRADTHQITVRKGFGLQAVDDCSPRERQSVPERLMQS